mmetsp:Transcript_22396/g.49057  ORF Transcript_22396/g.49057 Transcript_22396/m.49057 type:complete len:379 (-) Transcript_22396:1299-2435(-)
MMVTGRMLKNEHWPFYRLAAAGALLTALGLTLVGCLKKIPLPPRRVAIWVLLRGLASPGSILCATLAARTGCSPGDVSALNSINTIVGALLGFLFLGEPILMKHGIAMVCAVVGAVLISKPEFLFDAGHHLGGHHVPAISYFLALLSGCSQACIALCSRKIGPISVLWPTVSACLQSTLWYCVLTWTGIINDFTLEPIEEYPARAVGLFALVFGLTAATVCLTSCGTQWCPATISTVLFTTASLVWGYLAQVAIFHKPLEWITILGAAFMLVGVVVLTCWRKPSKSTEEMVADKVAADETLPSDTEEGAKASDSVHVITEDAETTEGDEQHDEFESFDDLASNYSAFGENIVMSAQLSESPHSNPSTVPPQNFGADNV